MATCRQRHLPPTRTERHWTDRRVKKIVAYYHLHIVWLMGNICDSRTHFT
jgi:hypothetical protein